MVGSELMANTLPFLTGPDVHCEGGFQVYSSYTSYHSLKLDVMFSWPPKYHLACLHLSPHLNYSLLRSHVQIKTNFTYIPFMVPGNLHVSMEGNTIPEDVTAYSCHRLWIPTQGLLTGSQGWNPDRHCTCWRNWSNQSLFRGKGTSVEISFIRLQIAFPQATWNLDSSET